MSPISHSLSLIRGFLLLALAMSYLVYAIFSLDISNFLIILVMLTFIVSWPGLTTFAKMMSSILIIFGHLLFFFNHSNFLYWKAALLNNVGLVSLFISVPLLSYPLKNGGYVEYMDQFIKRYLKKDVKLVAFVTAITCIISSFINLGSMRVVYELFSHRFSTKDLFARSLTQGYSLAAFWSPYFAGVAIILHLVGVSFVSFMFYGLVMAGCSFMISFFLNLKFIYSHEEKEGYQYLAVGSEGNGGEKRISQPSHKKGLELVVAFIGLFAILFFLEKLVKLNVVLLITIVAFIYPIIWSVFLKKVKAYFLSFKEYALEVVPNVHNESIMIIAATFFSQMVLLTNFSQFLSGLFMTISQLSTMLTIFVIIVVCVVTSLFMHQVLPISVFATTLTPEILGLKPELFVLTLVISWGLTPLLSPVSAANLAAGQLLKTTQFELGLWNMKYALVIIIFSSLFIPFLNLL